MVLRNIRDYYGFSQHTLAQLLGISRSYLAQIEAGYRELTPAIERQASSLFDIKAAQANAIRMAEMKGRF